MTLQLQGWDRLISDMYSTVKAFETKLTLWEAQMREEYWSHFPSGHTMKEKLSIGVFLSTQFAKTKISMFAADYNNEHSISFGPRLEAKFFCLALRS